MLDKILILDFGSQYTQLIGRKVRELRFYTEIHPFNLSIKEIEKLNPRGIILSGGPSSVYEKGAPFPDKKIFELKVPILGICYGLQYICHAFNGKVEAASSREYGFAGIQIRKKHPFTDKITQNSQVWMSHSDKVTKLPLDFEVLCETSSSPYAVVAHKKMPIVGVQFHPEVYHSKQGKIFLNNFCAGMCQMKPNWTMANFAKSEIRAIKDTVKDQRVMLGLSGGVDSLVAAKIIHQAIGDQLSCVYVDNGLMRSNETAKVKENFKKNFSIPLHVVAAEKRFLEALQGVSEPEKKRKIIGRLFIEEFQKKALELGHHEFLAQGTLYTDVIESVSVKGPSQTIKSHHNRVAEVLKLIQAGKVIEPLKELFKDEVRRLGLTLKLPREHLYRHPFPGPGLAIRILGEITEARLKVLRQADAILLEELKSRNLYSKIWQAFAVFLPIQSVGVMGDQRTYENVIALRMVASSDGMTADFAKVPMAVLGRISNRIINEVKGVNRVVYDISSKPPATIEWE